MDEVIPHGAKPSTGGKAILSIKSMKAAAEPMPKTPPGLCAGDEGA